MNRLISDLIGTVKSTFRINRATIDANALTTARTLTVPDKSGTLATLDDVQADYSNIFLWRG
jgi:hypothetical protein